MITFHNGRFSYWLLICLGLCSIQANSALGQLHCLNYTIQDGLPSNFITCATEDHDGFMWFGSTNGICKFDGFTFDNYSHLDTETSPGGDYITAIEIDNNNDLWVGTGNGGLYYLNRRNNIWEHFAVSKTKYYQLKGNEIFFINSDQNGNIWYGSDYGGLGCINPKAHTHENFNIDTLPRLNTWVNRTYNMVEDLYDPSIIHLVGQGYLYQFNKETKRFTESITQKAEVGDNFVFNPLSVIQTSATEFLLGCFYSGVKSYDQKTGQFQDVYPREFDQSLRCRADIYGGGENELWITVRDEGIARVDKDSGDLELFKAEPFNRNGLLKGAYTSIYQSSLGQTWVTTSEGISLIIPQYQAFEYHEADVSGPNIFLEIDTIPNSDNFLASYTGENSHLKILDKNMKMLSTFHVRKPADGFQFIDKIELSQETFLCLANQLYELDLKKETSYLKEIDGLPEGAQLLDFITLENQELWILLSSGHLLKYDKIEQKSELYPFSGYEETSEHKIIYHKMAKVGEQIWIPTHEELIVFNPIDGHSNYLYFEKNKLKHRNANEEIKTPVGSIKQVIPIDQNCAWVLTDEEGVYKICVSPMDSFIVLEHRDKRDLSQLLGPFEMVKGQTDDYWIASKNGLVHADSNLVQFKIFNQSEGLKSSSLEGGLTRVGDYLYMGMPKGFARVNTKDLLKEKEEGKIQIIKAAIGDISIGDDETPHFSHQQNNFLVAVATPNYNEARQVVIAHRLINHTDEWEFSGPDEKTFRYDKLLPGDYTFEVKTKSPSLKWSPVASKHFIIKAPYWKRNWFRLLMGFSILALIYFLYKWNLNRKLEKEKVKTEMAELEGRALRAQMNPHFIFNSLNSIKSLVLLDRKKEGITYLTKFSRMVREILAHSKEKQITLQKELELLGIYLDMESLRFEGKFEYQIDVSSEVNTYQVMVPPLIIQPFAENSIWHGLLHMEGAAKLAINIWLDEFFLYITIKDNGIGRKAAAQVKDKKSLYGKTSEGLKLSINRLNLISEFAEIDIKDLYEKEKSTGTLVTIKLPAHYE